MKYLGNTIFEYIKGGSHDGSEREIEAERGREQYNELKKHNTRNKKCNFVDVLSSDITDEEKIKAIDDIWKDYIEFSKGK